MRELPYPRDCQPNSPPDWIGHHSFVVDQGFDGVYRLQYSIMSSGIFECRIVYDDVVIHGGEFTCCVISGMCSTGRQAGNATCYLLIHMQSRTGTREHCTKGTAQQGGLEDLNGRASRHDCIFESQHGTAIAVDLSVVDL
jgi:hypothetical protein